MSSNRRKSLTSSKIVSQLVDDTSESQHSDSELIISPAASTSSSQITVRSKKPLPPVPTTNWALSVPKRKLTWTDDEEASTSASASKRNKADNLQLKLCTGKDG
jgi:hypothetical protein